MTRSMERSSSVAVQPPEPQRYTVALIFILTLLFFSLLTFRVIPPGDAAQNLYHVLTRDLGPRPVFISYTVIGIGFTSVFSALGLPVDVALNFMSAVFGALGATCGYLIAHTLVRDRRIALTAVVITALNGVYWYQAEIGDLYMTSYALVLLAMACFLYGRYVWAGGIYAVAILAYPVAAMVAPFFLWVAYRERIGGRNFLFFVFAGAAIYLPVILITFQEYFFGRMGIIPTLLVEPVATEGRLKLDIMRTITHFGYVYTLSFNVLLLLVAYAVIDTFFRRRAVWSVVMSAALGPMAFAFLNKGTDLVDPYHFASIPFLAILASLSLWYLLSRLFASRTLQALAVAACLIVYGGLSYTWVLAPFRDDVVALKQAFLQMERELPADAVILASWGVSLHYNLYTRPFIYDQPYPEVMRTGRCQEIYRITAPQLKEWLSSRSQIYLLDGIFWNSPLKETIQSLLANHIYQRLSGTRSLTKVVRALHDGVSFVRLDTFATGPLVLYQILPAQADRHPILSEIQTATLRR